MGRIMNHSVISFFIQEITNFYGYFKKKENKQETEMLLDAIEGAYQEWKNAEIFFQNVTDTDLIDCAIYKIDAALKRYCFLLKQAKMQKIKRYWKIEKLK